MHQPVQSIYPHNNNLPQTNRSLPIPCSSPPQSSFSPTPKFIFPHPKVPFFLSQKFRFSSSRNIFFLPSHQSIILSASTLIPSCFHPAFASSPTSLYPFFIPSFPFLEALAQEELTNGLLTGESIANLQRTQRQKTEKLGLGWNEEESLYH